MRLLENSPKVAPLLARLHEYHHPGQSDGSMHHELSAVMADMLSLDLKPLESELVTDVLLELMRQAECDLRGALAQRLAHMDGIPLRMILYLANDEISVAEPILRHSPVLQDMDLIYIINAQHEAHWRSIAKRRTLSAPVIDALADTKDLGTAVTLAENKAITLTEYALDLFVPLAGQAERLARPLLARAELPQGIVSRLYEVVGEELKKQIRARFDMDAGQVETVVDEIVSEARQIDNSHYLPSDALLRAAQTLRDRGLLDSAAMLSSIKRGMLTSFIAQFSVYAELAPDVVLDMLAQKSGQSLAVACKAVGIRKPDFMSFYLMSHRIRKTYQPVIDNHQLTMAVRTYDGIPAQDALRLLRQSQSLH